MPDYSGPLYSFRESQATGLLQRSVDPIVRSIDVKFVPFREIFGYNGLDVDATKIEYLERNDTPIIGSIGTAATGWNSASDISGLSVTDASVFCIYDVLLTSDGEIVIVTDLDEVANTINVIARGDCLSTESNANEDADEIRIIGQAQLEGYTYGLSPRFKTSVQKYNFVQLFHQDVEVTKLTQAIKKFGKKDLYAEELRKKTLRATKLLEQALLYGGPQVGDATNPGTLCGIIGPGANAWQTNIQTNVTDLSAATLTESSVLDECQGIHEAGGDANLVICPPKQKRAISGFRGSQRRYTGKETKIGDVVDTYFSDFGATQVVMNQYMKNSDLIIMDKALFKIGPVTGLGFHTGVLPQTKSAERGYIAGFYSSMLFDEEYCAHVKNIG